MNLSSHDHPTAAVSGSDRREGRRRGSRSCPTKRPRRRPRRLLVVALIATGKHRAVPCAGAKHSGWNRWKVRSNRWSLPRKDPTQRRRANDRKRNDLSARALRSAGDRQSISCTWRSCRCSPCVHASH